ncbi:basic salivary proline-rich protein 1-like [Entelurus aequoreus]|uniref:basic salivary proline-rich protein 1-like n=1 Tax=Entelurus aequoreus TaxID=161455 RepID=UPI002B1CEFA5|nr:basic salivary proline-rich protein 1-like [Entelurus aequoreus]
MCICMYNIFDSQCVWEPEYGSSHPESPTHKQQVWCPGNQGPPAPRSQPGQRQEPQSQAHRAARKSQQQAADGCTRQRTRHERSRGQPDLKPARDHTPHGQKGGTPRPAGPESRRYRTGRPPPPHQQPGPHEPTPRPRRARRSPPTATPPEPTAAGPPSTGPREPPNPPAGTPTMEMEQPATTLSSSPPEKRGKLKIIKSLFENRFPLSRPLQ